MAMDSVSSSKDQKIYYCYARGGKYGDTENLETRESKRRKSTGAWTTSIRSRYWCNTTGTLPPRLYQINPFSRQQTDENLNTNVHELADNEMPATTGEMGQVEDEEANSFRSNWDNY
jgi:hypothetical protein